MVVHTYNQAEVLRRLRQEDCELETSPAYRKFKTSLGYLARPCLKKNYLANYINKIKSKENQ
jgi:hypothetical protein